MLYVWRSRVLRPRSPYLEVVAVVEDVLKLEAVEEMGKKAKIKGGFHNAQKPQPIRDLRFLTTVKVSPPAPIVQVSHRKPAQKKLAERVSKIAERLSSRKVREVHHNPRVAVAQNNVKWSGKQMGNTKFSMFTKKTGLNTIMSNKDGKGGMKIPVLLAILALVIGGGGYFAYNSLTSTEWGRISSGDETNKWLDNVSTQRNQATPSKKSNSQVAQSEAYKTWGNTSLKTSTKKSHQTKKVSSSKSASKKHLSKHSSKKQNVKKYASSKKKSSKKNTSAKHSSKKQIKNSKYAKGKKNQKSENISRTSGSR